MPSFDSVDAVPMGGLAGFQQKVDGRGARPAVGGYLVPKGLAIPSAFRVRRKTKLAG